MSSGLTGDHGGCFHETAFYGSDNEFLEIVVPFLIGGLQAGEPTVVALGETNERLVGAAIPDTSGITFLPACSHYTRPATVIRDFQELLGAHVARGAPRIRIVGDVPHPGLGSPWEWWGRYEAAVNHAYHDFPLWGLCPYDTRVTPDEVLADVTRTHPYIATSDGRHVRNTGYQEPTAFLTRRATGRDVLEMSPPVIDLIDPTPAVARRAVLTASHPTHLSAVEINDMVYAASEAVSNGFCHGRPPVRFRLWADADRMVATVSDQGSGPSCPFAGLLPATDSSSAGLGLWIIHQICSYVALDWSAAGFTIRLITGRPRLVEVSLVE